MVHFSCIYIRCHGCKHSLTKTPSQHWLKLKLLEDVHHSLGLMAPKQWRPSLALARKQAVSGEKHGMGPTASATGEPSEDERPVEDRMHDLSLAGASPPTSRRRSQHTQGRSGRQGDAYAGVSGSASVVSEADSASSEWDFLGTPPASPKQYVPPLDAPQQARTPGQADPGTMPLMILDARGRLLYKLRLSKDTDLSSFQTCVEAHTGIVPCRQRYLSGGMLVTEATVVHELDVVGDGVLVLHEAPRELRAYVVWRNPAASRGLGIWYGGRLAWPNIVRQLPGGQYLYANGTRLRACADAEDALDVYLAEASEHGSPLPPRMHWAGPYSL